MKHDTTNFRAAFGFRRGGAALKETPDGFLLADLPLGTGVLPLRQMISVLTKANPKLRMSLEMMTRDAPPTPCLTDKYHAVMPGRSGLQLARTLRLARDHSNIKMPRSQPPGSRSEAPSARRERQEILRLRPY